VPSIVLVLGGRSEIGVALAARLAADRRADVVVLAARRPEALEAEIAAVRAAGARVVEGVAFDADDLDAHARVWDDVVARHGAPTTVVVAFGILGDQARAEDDARFAAAVVHTDYTAQVAALTGIASRMRARGAGEIVAFSSIAGVRVRRANYVYGSAKAGLDGFARGLADALRGSGVHLTLVRPGFVVGRMTAGSGLDPAPLSSTPEQVAATTASALARGRDVVWVPPALAVLATVLRLLPRPVFRRLGR
jgi:short-subunit dehydrogenase